MTGILYLTAVLGAELLTQLHGACGADLYALATCHAVALLHAGNIGAAGEVGGVEQLRGTQCVADVNVAVADGEDLILAVDVGDLMDEAVLLTLTEDVQRLFAGDVAAALARLYHVICHVAHGHAPALGVVGAALIEGEAGLTAGAGGGGVLAVILIQPVGDMLKVDGGVLRLNGLLHRDDMHADAGTAGRHHGGDLLQGQAGHTLEEVTHLGVLLQDGVVHVGELGAAGDEHGQHPLLGTGGVLPVVLDDAAEGHLIQETKEFFFLHTGEFHKLRQSLGLAHLHFHCHFRHFVRQQQGKAPILGVILGELLEAQFHGDAVGDHLA